MTLTHVEAIAAQLGYVQVGQLWEHNLLHGEGDVIKIKEVTEETVRLEFAHGYTAVWNRDVFLRVWRPCKSS